MRRAGDRDASDEELVARFRSGDQHAFTTLVSRHERRVFNIAFRMLGRAEEARDATQEAFLACYRNLDRFRGESAFTTWLHRIAVNASHDVLRKKVPEPVAEIEETGEAGPDLADQAAAAIDVQRALMAVGLDFRAVLVLHDVQGLPYEEVAEILGIPLGTVKSRLHRGRVALGAALAGEPQPSSGPSKDATR